MSITYKLNVMSPWRLRRVGWWRWMPVHYFGAGQNVYGWLCFEVESHVVGATAYEREVSPVPREGFGREAVQGATRYYEWARYTRRPDLDSVSKEKP